MSSRGISKLPRMVRLGALAVAIFIVWTAIKWIVRIYVVVWLETLGVPPAAGLLIAFGVIAAVVAVAAYFLKPWFDRLDKGDRSKDK